MGKQMTIRRPLVDSFSRAWGDPAEELAQSQHMQPKKLTLWQLLL